ncbi:MAG TPA: tetratricopeptide repeat protein, partial [Chthoniobacterales bacterium]
AWAFEITPEGIKRADDVAPDESTPHRTSRKLIGITIAVAVAAGGMLAFQLFRPRLMTERISAPSQAAPVALISEKSIAVLPFENLSDEKQNAYFTDGVQDEILTHLSKIADLKVISRTSVMQYKAGAQRNPREIGQQLGVAHLLEGSVQRSANKIRVNAQLIDARTDAHIWAETYDRDLADLFAIQTEIARTIADQLQAKLSPKEKSVISDRPTADLAAYDLYLQAKQLIYGDFNTSHWKENALKAVQLLEQAVARDPAFLPAFCQLAFAHDRLYFSRGDSTEARLALAETNVRAAVHLQPDAGETHLAQAIHFYWGYRDYDRARAELALAQTGLPNNGRIFQFLGLIARRQGRWDEAVRNLERALDRDPRNADALGDLGDTYFHLHRYGETIAVTERSLALRPGNAFLRASIASVRADADANLAPLRATLQTIETESPASAPEVAGMLFETARRERDPIAAARALANISKDGFTNGINQFPHAFYAGTVAKLRQDAPGAHAAFMDARVEAEKIVRAQPKNARALSVLAMIDAQLGEKETAIREARTACDMLPVSKDAMEGVGLIIKLATVYALTGEKDLALEQLAIAATLPGGPTYGNLRLGPDWDSLRSDPRFEKIVAALAPTGKVLM